MTVLTVKPQHQWCWLVRLGLASCLCRIDCVMACDVDAKGRLGHHNGQFPQALLAKGTHLNRPVTTFRGLRHSGRRSLTHSLVFAKDLLRKLLDPKQDPKARPSSVGLLRHRRWDLLQHAAHAGGGPPHVGGGVSRRPELNACDQEAQGKQRTDGHFQAATVGMARVACCGGRRRQWRQNVVQGTPDFGCAPRLVRHSRGNSKQTTNQIPS
mmetsp:Transcript_5170/g.12675  ORF Transcript_5170/g.12675 Transcript_5170/m.12675 type:complete len:211 (+) Transcript_5170:689-1321(+)